MFPVDLACLHPESFAPCDLYKKSEEKDFVLFARRGIPFDNIVKSVLKENCINQLYIKKDEVDEYFDYMKYELTQLVKNPNASSTSKANAVNATCKEVLKKVFDEPRSFFVNKAIDIINPAINLIVSDDHAVRHLVQLTSYDHCTYIHSTNVGIFSIALARIFFGANAAHDMNKLGAGFFLHDLGKCKIPLEIINKTGPLTEEERTVVKRHPEEGYRLLMESGYSTEETQIIVLQHHERDNGTGYPNGLKGGEIHPYARICRLADIYEALTSERPYHKRRTTFEALKIIKEQMSDVDQNLISCFINLFVPS